MPPAAAPTAAPLPALPNAAPMAAPPAAPTAPPRSAPRAADPVGEPDVCIASSRHSHWSLERYWARELPKVSTVGVQLLCALAQVAKNIRQTATANRTRLMREASWL